MRSKSGIWDDVAAALVGIPIAFSLQKIISFVLISKGGTLTLQEFFFLSGTIAFYTLYYFSYTPALLSQLRLHLLEEGFPCHGVWALIFLLLCLGGILAMGVMFDKTHYNYTKALIGALVATVGMVGAHLHVSVVGVRDEYNKLFDFLFVMVAMMIVFILRLS